MAVTTSEHVHTIGTWSFKWLSGVPWYVGSRIAVMTRKSSASGIFADIGMTSMEYCASKKERIAGLCGPRYFFVPRPDLSKR